MYYPDPRAKEEYIEFSKKELELMQATTKRMNGSDMRRFAERLKEAVASASPEEVGEVIDEACDSLRFSQARLEEGRTSMARAQFYRHLGYVTETFNMLMMDLDGVTNIDMAQYVLDLFDEVLASHFEVDTILAQKR